MNEKWHVQELKERAFKAGKQFVHIVMPGENRVLIIGEQRTEVFEMGSGEVTNPDAAMFHSATVPTMFKFPHKLMLFTD